MLTPLNLFFEGAFLLSLVLFFTTAVSVGATARLESVWSATIASVFRLGDPLAWFLQNIESILAQLGELSAEAASYTIDYLSLPLAAKYKRDKDAYIRAAFGPIRVHSPLIVLRHLDDVWDEGRLEDLALDWKRNFVVDREMLRSYELNLERNKKIVVQLKYVVSGQREWVNKYEHLWSYNMSLCSRFASDIEHVHSYAELLELVHAKPHFSGRTGWARVFATTIDILSGRYPRKIAEVRQDALRVLLLSYELKRKLGELDNHLEIR